MGVIYKITPEIIEFILEEKRKNPALSCRGLSDAVRKRFSLLLSKSSVNAIMHKSGLSSPVGRKRGSRNRIA